MKINQSQEKIPCSVGILTYNSEKTLRLALESVKNFSNIIISDGGSVDDTLDIAAEYNCTIIEQYAKSNPSGHEDYPIEDFARERNLLIDNATQDWFFWLDSDEYISHELHDELEKACHQKNIKYFAYEVPLVHQSPDTTVTYDVLKQIYQTRFFNLTTQGRFQRKMHERFIFDTTLYATGRLSGSWFVPMSKTEFPEYKKAVNYRIRLTLSHIQKLTFLTYIRKAYYQTVRRALGILYRACMARILFGFKNVIPLSYERNRLYSQWVTFREVNRLYFRKNKV